MTDRTAEQAAEALRVADVAVDSALGMVEEDQFLPDWDFLRSARKQIREALAALTAEATHVSPDREALARWYDEKGKDHFADTEWDRAERVRYRETAAALRSPAQAEAEAMARDIDWCAQNRHSASPSKSRLLGWSAMLRRLASPSPAVGEWRDIASAPRDGTHIWLARVGAPSSIVGYFSGYYGWMDTSGEVLDDRGIRDNRPTHWQDYVRPAPPAPPQETKP